MPRLLKYVPLFILMFSSVCYSQPVFWKQIDTLKNESIFSMTVNSKGWIFTGSWLGKISFSSDKGETWKVKNTGSISNLIYCLTVNNEDHLFAGTIGGGVLRSTDEGENWSYSGLNDFSVISLAVDSRSNIYAATGGRSNSVFRSSDNGDLWIECSSGINSGIQALAVNSKDHIFAGTLDGIFVSTDGGSSWMQKNNGLTNTSVYSLVIDSDNSIFAGTFHEGEIFYSSDSGANWILKTNSLNTSFIRSFALSGKRIYAGSYDGIFMSEDRCESWLPINSGLANTMVQTLAADEDGYIYAGTWGAGAYKNTSLTPAFEDRKVIPAYFSLEQNYPNPFNPHTKIRYSLPIASFVQIRLYDIIGNEIAVLVNETKKPGNYELDFHSGKFNLSSGVYFYTMSAGKFFVTKKFILVK